MNVIDQQSNTTIIIFSKYINAELTEGNVPGLLYVREGEPFSMNLKLYSDVDGPV